MRSGIAGARLARVGLALLLACAVDAFAFPVTWTLSGATFSDGGTAAGSFVFDADTQVVSDWSIDVAGGNTGTFPPLSYTPATSSSGFNAAFGVQFIENGSVRALRLPPTSAYSDAGGTVSIDLANLYQGECFNCSPYRSFTAGTLTGYAAPVFTSADATTFALGSAGSFAITVTGTPALTVSESGALPPGVNFVDNGNGSATLAGVPTASGVYPIVLSASNGAAPATQNFTLTVAAPPPPASPAPALDSIGKALLGLSLVGLAALMDRRRQRRAR